VVEGFDVLALDADAIVERFDVFVLPGLAW
jgi:hypothetical protein